LEITQPVVIPKTFGLKESACLPGEKADSSPLKRFGMTNSVFSASMTRAAPLLQLDFTFSL
jgi:hypothetical protein